MTPLLGTRTLWAYGYSLPTCRLKRCKRLYGLPPVGFNCAFRFSRFTPSQGEDGHKGNGSSGCPLGVAVLTLYLKSSIPYKIFQDGKLHKNYNNFLSILYKCHKMGKYNKNGRKQDAFIILWKTCKSKPTR